MSKLSLDETRELRILISQVKSLCQSLKDILADSTVNNLGRYSSYRPMASTYNDLVIKANQLVNISSLCYSFNMDALPTYGNATWPQEKSIMEQVLVSAELLLATLEGHMDFVDDEFDNLQNFLKNRLRTVIFRIPEKEIEIQNSIETLLIGKGMAKGVDYDRETGKFDFSGREYIPDFIIPKLNLCIEVKLLRPGKKSAIIEQINADITAYKKQYQRLLFVVYDLGVIQNEAEFARDIENVEDTKLVIVKN